MGPNFTVDERVVTMTAPVLVSGRYFRMSTRPSRRPRYADRNAGYHSYRKRVTRSYSSGRPASASMLDDLVCALTLQRL